MGAVYTVSLKLNYKNKDSAKNLLSKYISDLLEISPKRFDGRFVPDSSIEEMFGLMLAKNQGYYENYKEDGIDCYESDFNASYGWSSVLDNMFDVLVPYLKDNSYYYQVCENDWDEYLIEDGVKKLSASSWQKIA